MSSKSFSVSKTKVLPDVKRKLQEGGHYQLAYISDSGAMIRVGKKMDFVTAAAALGASGAVNSLSVHL